MLVTHLSWSWNLILLKESCSNTCDSSSFAWWRVTNLFYNLTTFSAKLFQYFPETCIFALKCVPCYVSPGCNLGCVLMNWRVELVLTVFKYSHMISIPSQKLHHQFQMRPNSDKGDRIKGCKSHTCHFVDIGEMWHEQSPLEHL